MNSCTQLLFITIVALCSLSATNSDSCEGDTSCKDEPKQNLYSQSKCKTSPSIAELNTAFFFCSSQPHRGGDYKGCGCI